MYKRKVSFEEEKGGFLFILKDRLGFFPQGKDFLLRKGGRRISARIEAVWCDCVGAPHNHYHLLSEATRGLKKGSVITIENIGGTYTMKIEKD